MITGSEGVSLRFPQLFLSQHRLREEKRRPSGKKTQGKVGGNLGIGYILWNFQIRGLSGSVAVRAFRLH